MNRRTTPSHPSGIFGAASLLVIFAVLCLTTLALLTLQTVKHGTEASERAAAQTAQWYEAEAVMHRSIAELREGKMTEQTGKTEGSVTIALQVSDDRIIEVTVALDGNGGYTVLDWRRGSGIDWQPDDSVELWDGTIPD